VLKNLLLIYAIGSALRLEPEILLIDAVNFLTHTNQRHTVLRSSHSHVRGPVMKRLLIAALLCVSALYSATAQNNPNSLNEINGTPINQSISGDFNGDGLTDFVFVANAQSGQLQLTTYLGRGDGFITGIKNSFLSINPSWKVPQFTPGPSADFNGDGKQDILFLGSIPGTPLPTTILLINLAANYSYQCFGWRCPYNSDSSLGKYSVWGDG
jgi:hypothetical protein